MDVISKEELRERLIPYLKILSQNLFVHPTDTIYGLGCDATNTKLVKKLREVKNNHDKPFSVIAPSKEWILENCDVKGMEKNLDLLPGPTTLILPLKNTDCVSSQTNLSFDTIGVRIPNHWFSEIVSLLNIPIITTSANVLGDELITSIDELSSKIKPFVKLAIDDGPIKGSPSKIISVDEVLRH